MPPPQLNNSSKHRKQLKITTQVMMGSQPLDSIRETPPPPQISFNDMPIVQDAVLASIRPVHRLFKTSFVSTGLRPVVRYMC